MSRYEFDVNDAVTRLNRAVEEEDYATANRIKEEIDAAMKANPLNDGGPAPALTWAATPPWLNSRLEDLGFRYPTPVQAAALSWHADGLEARSATDTASGGDADETPSEPLSEPPAEPAMEPMVPAFEVIVPDGLVAGDILAVETDDGSQYNVMVPEGCGPGDSLLIDLPGAAPGSAPSPSPLQRDAVISAPTGAGKTLAFVVPMLCESAAELERRSTLAVDALGLAGDALSPAETMVALSPKLQLPGAAPPAGDRAASLLPVRGPPLGLIITPTASLAEQAARLLVSLVGRNDARDSLAAKSGAKGTLASSARYNGPRAVSVAALKTLQDGVAAAASAAEGVGPLCDCDVLVVSSAALEPARAAIDTSALRMACVDEADACDCAALRDLPDAVSRVLIGATVGKAVALAVESGWISTPMLMDGRTVRKWTEDDLAQALCPPGLTHRFSVAPESGDENAVQLQLLALARLLRKDLRDWEELGAAAVQAPSPAFSQARGLASDVPDAAPPGEGVSRPRAVVFTKDCAEALRVGSALRDALWGEQAVATRAGETPESGAAAFKSIRALNEGSADFDSVIQAGGASILVVPMSEGRGLDYPDITHVYCLDLGLGPEQVNDYAHMAGRAGRVGQNGRGVVTSVLSSGPEWVGVLNGLNAIVKGSLGRDLEAVAVPSTAEDLDTRRALEDLFLLTEEVSEELSEEDPEAASM